MKISRSISNFLDSKVCENNEKLDCFLVKRFQTGDKV